MLYIAELEKFRDIVRAKEERGREKTPLSEL
jgi:hypothetical protein